MLNDITQLINGYARIVIYEVHSFNKQIKSFDPLFEPHFNKIIHVQEGVYVNGDIFGFGKDYNIE